MTCAKNVSSLGFHKSRPTGHAEIVRRGLAVDLLVNNAGFGLTGPFLSHALSEERLVSETLRAFDKKQAVLVPGTLTTRIQAFAHRVLPRTVVARIAASVSTKIMTNDNKRKESSNVTSQP